MSEIVIEEAVLDLSHVTTEKAIVHTLPYVGPHCNATPSFRIVDTASITMKDISLDAVTVITGTAPLEGQALEASRQELARSIEQMRVSAKEEGGNGFVLGCDPLYPKARIPSSELAMGVDCVFVWDRARGDGPIFDWSEVAHLVTREDSAYIFLVDGRLIVIHADIDWWNLLG